MKKKTHAKRKVSSKPTKTLVPHTLILIGSVTGIASLWFGISYSNNIDFPLHAATNANLLADASDSSSSDFSDWMNLPDSYSAPGADVKKVLDTTPPVISAISGSYVTSNAITITWTTDEFSTGQVTYGPSVYYGKSTPLKAKLEQQHAFQLYDLEPSTKYYYEVSSRDHDGNVATTDNLTFTTAAADTVSHSAAPAGSMLSCADLQAATATSTKRGEFAIALLKVLGLKLNTLTRQLYIDVPVTHPAFQTVTTLQRAGLMQGYDAKAPSAPRQFGVDDAIPAAIKAIVYGRAQKKGLCQ